MRSQLCAPATLLFWKMFSRIDRRIVGLQGPSNNNYGHEIFTLLGCYAESIGSWLSTFRYKLSVSSSMAKQSKKSLWVIWSLKMEPIGRPETSVKNYQTTLRNTPEDRISYLHRRGSLKITLLCSCNAKSDEGPYGFQPHTERFIPNKLIFQIDPQIILIIIITLICSITSEYKA